MSVMKEDLITFQQAQHLMELELYPQPQHIKQWFVQYDIYGYWPNSEYETWSLEYKKDQDKTTDYGYSNRIFYPVTTKSFYEDVVKNKPKYSGNHVSGIADYEMYKYNY